MCTKFKPAENKLVFSYLPFSDFVEIVLSLARLHGRQGINHRVSESVLRVKI